MQNHVILLGCGRMGQQILDQLKTFKEDYVVVDHDNAVIKKLIEKDITCIFGDIEDSELIHELDLEEAEIIISTLPSREGNLFLIKRLAKMPPEKRPIVITVANSGRAGFELFNAGADYVILKPYLGAEHIHDINRKLYDLPEEPSTPLATVLAEDEKTKFKSDYQYAKLLHNLNKLRLAEIKQKIHKRHIVLKAKSKD